MREGGASHCFTCAFLRANAKRGLVGIMRTPQYTTIHCNTLHYTALHCSMLQHTAAHCKTWNAREKNAEGYRRVLC